MTFQLVTTPLRHGVPMPSPRAGGVDPRLLDSAVRPVGQPDPRQRLLEPDALVVTTGQQPGLFTGPLYTIYKAVSAAALARRLEAEWQRPVVPVFWLATDDHDFAEAIERPLVPLAAELAARGEDPAVAVGDGATLVFLDGAQGRDRLVRAGDKFRTRRGGETYSLADLSAIAAAEPERLSPNVLLRPVVESAVLPTVAYVAGPGELRYLALTPPVYAELGVDRQLPVARWSGLVVEPKVERVLAKFSLTVEDLLGPDGVIESRIARSQLPESVTSTVGRLRQAIEDEYGSLTAAAVSIDPTLEKTVQGARSNAVRGMEDIEKKLVQHLKKRSETELGQVGRARNLVRPDGKPQERVFTVAPYLARHGRAFLDAVLTEASSWYAGALEGAGTRS